MNSDIEEQLDVLIKGKPAAAIGEVREFSGRKMVKTTDGWKPATETVREQKDNQKRKQKESGGDGGSSADLDRHAKNTDTKVLQWVVKNSKKTDLKRSAEKELKRRNIYREDYR